jgi:hypothetical protein
MSDTTRRDDKDKSFRKKQPTNANTTLRILPRFSLHSLCVVSCCTVVRTALSQPTLLLRARLRGICIFAIK